MAARMGGVVPESDPKAQLVEQVGRKIVQRGDAARSPYVDSFDFHLLADADTINAFALPGGQVFITQGLLDRMPDEAALAGVLGHEVGHVVHRHAAEQIAKSQLGAALAQAAGVAASDGSDGGQRAAMIGAMVNQVVQLRYGRADESESDRYGVDAMADSGYDPRAMLEVMKVLARAAGGQRQPEWLSSHPLPETRIAEIEEYLRKRSGSVEPVSGARPN
jgi:predicted Zn-dependent protease